MDEVPNGFSRKMRLSSDGDVECGNWDSEGYRDVPCADLQRSHTLAHSFTPSKFRRPAVMVRTMNARLF